MNKIILLLLSAIAACEASGGWSYKGATGPAHWHVNYPICGQKKQSPVNIRTRRTSYKEARIKDTYEHASGMTYVLANNGHSAQVTLSNVPTSVQLTVFGGTFRPWQFHFHWGNRNRFGSEHQLNGDAFPAEMHFVHINNKYKTSAEALKHSDGLLVLGTFVEVCYIGDGLFNSLVDHFGDIQYKGENITIPAIDLPDLFPSNMEDFFYYDGSLTTPTCNEAVLWVVFKKNICMSRSQMRSFRRLKSSAAGDHKEYIANNFRPVQNLNGRKIYRNFRSD